METYNNLIHKTFEFPNNEFHTEENHLFFNNVNLMKIVAKYGTPIRLTYLPKIGEKIQQAKSLFESAIKEHDYKGDYTYTYCTKSSHFKFVIEETLNNNAQIETSSAFDMDIIKSLEQKGKINKDLLVICNGFKRPEYIKNITNMINDGFNNVIPILDNMEELNEYTPNINKEYQIGIRCATDEEPTFEFYTSRLGIRYTEITNYYINHIAPLENVKLKVLHFFINTGVKDSTYYWSELSKLVHQYCELSKICPELDTLDIGGGFPIKTSLNFNFDYQYFVNEIIKLIKSICKTHNVNEPNILTEFGSFTVGESGAMLYKVLKSKQQNDKEKWYMIDSSFITNMPDTWAINQRFIMLSLNNWNKEYQKVNIGGLTCDSQDYYNSEAHDHNIYLPQYNSEDEYQFIGFFHTGAYQESIGGYGGIQHCLIPNTKHVLVRKDENGELVDELFEEEQTSDAMLKILGYL